MWWWWWQENSGPWPVTWPSRVVAGQLHCTTATPNIPSNGAMGGTVCQATSLILPGLSNLLTTLASLASTPASLPWWECSGSGSCGSRCCLYEEEGSQGWTMTGLVGQTGWVPPSLFRLQDEYATPSPLSLMMSFTLILSSPSTPYRTKIHSRKIPFIVGNV